MVATNAAVGIALFEGRRDHRATDERLTERKKCICWGKGSMVRMMCISLAQSKGTPNAGAKRRWSRLGKGRKKRPRVASPSFPSPRNPLTVAASVTISPAMDFTFDHNKLIRTMSAPRRCTVCSKMVYFRTVRCKECGNYMHGSCASRTTHLCQKTRRNSHEAEQTKSADLDLREVKSANNWRFSSLPESSVDFEAPLCETEQRSDEDAVFSETSPRKGSRDSDSPVGVNGLLKLANWLSHRSHSKRFVNKANSEDKHSKIKFGLIGGEAAEQQLKALIKNPAKRASMGPIEAKSPDNNRKSFFERFKYRSLIIKPTDSGCESSSSAAAQSLAESATSPVPGIRRTCHSVRKPTDKQVAFSKLNKVPFNHCISTIGDCSGSRYVGSRGKFGKHYLLGKARTLSLETKSGVTERMWTTWPQTGAMVSSIEELLDVEPDLGLDEEGERLLRSIGSEDFDIQEAMKEWSIPSHDLQFKEVLREGRFGKIFRGQWHGDVLIYSFDYCSEEDQVSQFWEEIAQFSLIRHENIMLFMGACLEPQRLAVITSMRKGPSLFEYIHIKQQCLPIPQKISIARQVAQAMGYLHAKNILHKRLNSNNVILENKIKVCFMDQGMARSAKDRDDYGFVPRGHLTYLSPELIRSLQVEPPYLYLNQEHAQESDVYSFGTLLYELFSSQFPFQQLNSHQIIWRVGNGNQENTDSIKYSCSLKGLISKCWAWNPYHRPKFGLIVRQLQENVNLHKKHSSSEPETMHKTGMSAPNGLAS